MYLTNLATGVRKLTHTAAIYAHPVNSDSSRHRLNPLESRPHIHPLGRISFDPRPFEKESLVVTNYIQALFTDSAFGSLEEVRPWVRSESSGRSEAINPGGAKDGSNATNNVGAEALGFPRGTDPRVLAEILREVHAASPLNREALLRRPGFLGRICSQSAANASYAIWILAIAESPDFHSMLAKLGPT